MAKGAALFPLRADDVSDLLARQVATVGLPATHMIDAHVGNARRARVRALFTTDPLPLPPARPTLLSILQQSNAPILDASTRPKIDPPLARQANAVGSHASPRKDDITTNKLQENSQPIAGPQPVERLVPVEGLVPSNIPVHLTLPNPDHLVAHTYAISDFSKESTIEMHDIEISPGPPSVKPSPPPESGMAGEWRLVHDGGWAPHLHDLKAHLGGAGPLPSPDDTLGRQRHHFVDLISRMLVMDPAHRITVQQALAHPFCRGDDASPESLAIHPRLSHSTN